MTKLSTSNRNFNLMVRRIQNAMPYISVSILILVYIVSGLIEGNYLSSSMGGTLWSSILAYAIAYSLQIARCTVVFFDQLNPQKLSRGIGSEIIAVVFGLLAIGSIVMLALKEGMSSEVAFSMGVLMAVGILLEIKFLGEIRKANDDRIQKEIGIETIAKEAMETKQIRLQLKAIDMVSNEFDDQEIEQYRQKLLKAASPTPSPVKIHSTKDLNEREKKHVQLMIEKRLPVNDINVFIETALEGKDENKKEELPLELSVLNGSTPH